MNRYYGNVKQGSRRDSLTNFSNGPLTPGGQTKVPTGSSVLLTRAIHAAEAISSLVPFPLSYVLRVSYSRSHHCCQATVTGHPHFLCEKPPDAPAREGKSRESVNVTLTMFT